MENYYIEGSEERPTINFDVETGILEISDSSYPEYTNEIYNPVMEWLEEYLKESHRVIVFNFKLDYFNTSTSFRFQQIINLLNEYHLERQGNVTINWYYQDGDIDMQENGEDYAKDAKAPFNLLCYE
jgi:SiaC family regulatory phosphoprotein